MLKFNSDLLTHEYVYISAISKDNIIVANDDNGEIYRPEAKHRVRRNGDTAVRIHKKVYDLYSRYSPISTFHRPRRACIFYYSGYPLMIDVYQPYSAFRDANGLVVPEDQWESGNIQAFSRLESLLETKGEDIEVYIDGDTIMFRDSANPNPIYKHDKSGFFTQHVRYIRLSKMCVKLTRRSLELLTDRKDNDAKALSRATQAKPKEGEEKAEAGSEDSQKKEKKDNDPLSVVVLKEGRVIGFNPYYDSDLPHDEQDESLMVYSPVLGEDAIKLFNNEGKIDNFGHTEEVFFNLNFLVKAGRIIGRHYSFEETDFLDIPKVIKDTGIFNIASDISYKSKQHYPISLHYNDVLAYMFRFLHRETDLHVYRDLNSLFTMAMSSGSIKMTGKEKDIFHEGKSIADIKMRKLDIVDIGDKNYDPTKEDDLLTCPVAKKVKDDAEKRQNAIRHAIRRNHERRTA